MAVHTAGDESFAAYVSVRWSMLYRLAVLLAGTEHADDVTEAALLRAYVSWRRVQDAVSADVAVKKILVSTAVSAGEKAARDAESRSPDERTDDDELWSRISALPPRERAVVVLLYYEDLSEAQTARVLGRSQGTVKALAFTALTTEIGLADHTTLEVRDELARRADEPTIPPPPVAALLTRGRRERRLRVRRSLSWPAAAVVLVLVAVMLADVLGGSDSDPRRAERPAPSAPVAPAAVLPGSLARLAEGAPPGPAYVSRRTLHVNGRQVALAGRPSAIAQTPSTVFVTYRTGTVVQVDLATMKVERLTDSAAGPAVTDARGQYVAWPVVASGQASAVLRPVGSAGAAAEGQVQAFPATPRCCDNPFLLVGITRSGEVVGSMPAANRAWVWDTRPTRDPAEPAVREIAGLDDGVVDQVTSSEIVVHSPPFHYAVGGLRGEDLLVTGRISARAVDFGDPLGRRVVYVDDTGETHVRERLRPRRLRGGPFDLVLRLPALEVGFTSIYWEDPDHVLLDVSDDLVPWGALVRCSTDSGACEIAVRFDGPHLVAGG